MSELHPLSKQILDERKALSDTAEAMAQPKLDSKFIKVLVKRRFLDSATWYIGMVAADNVVVTMFDVEDEMEAEFMLQHPEKIKEELEKVRLSEKKLNDRYGGNPAHRDEEGDDNTQSLNEPTTENWWKIRPGSNARPRTSQPAKPKPPEKPKMGGIGDDIASEINTIAKQNKD